MEIEEIMTNEDLCEEAIEYLGLKLVCASRHHYSVYKCLKSGADAVCWFTWAEHQDKIGLCAYPANFPSISKDLCPLLLGTSTKPFFIRSFFWRDENGYDFSVENPFLGCRSVYEAKIKLDLMKG